MDATLDSLKSEVDQLIDNQRDESDARDILNHVERLSSFEGEQRFRWIWELIQNARDEAGGGVNIECELTDNSFTFRHDGQSFSSKNLIALTLRTSTKPIDASKGNAGKFGTGFVTTHLLNKKVNISGVHLNRFGKRRFTHSLDRSPIDLTQMVKNISESIQNIREVDKLPQETIVDVWNSFYYQLNPAGLEIARGGIHQLQNNLGFALLINPLIKSVTLIVNGERHVLTIKTSDNAISGLSFLRLIDDKKLDDNVGLLYLEVSQLLMAVPAELINGKYQLKAIEDRAHLFKELPLIGTEDFHLPAIIQHKNFQPTEQRDGVRTKIAPETEEIDDPKAHMNRDAFRDFNNSFPVFMNLLIEGKVNNLHLLAETGSPSNLDAYYGKTWFLPEVQDVLRASILSQKLVKNVSDSQILIKDAIFPDCDLSYLPQFYVLLADLLPEKTPDIESHQDWVRILSQDSDSWPKDCKINIIQLVEKAANNDFLETALPQLDRRISWLQGLIHYLELVQQERLGIENAIYPNQAGKLKTQNDIYKEIDLDAQFKLISMNMGRDLKEELLVSRFEATSVLDFNVKEFLLNLNNEIGQLKIEDATPGKIQGIMHICCTFKTAKAERREQWHGLLQKLLPSLISDKVYIELNEDYPWEPAERWALKYVCSLIEKSTTISTFSEVYFSAELNQAYKWLNDFLEFVFRNEENKEIGLRYKIILTQDGSFKAYTDNIYQEETPHSFDGLLKDLFRDYTGLGDPRKFLVDNAIRSENLRYAEVTLLTHDIDLLFNSRDAEDKVKDGQEYHQLFLALKDWLEGRENAEDYFPVFTKKQPILYIKAFGEGSSLGRLLKLKKTVDEIEQLDKLRLSPDQLRQLDDAVAIIGSVQSLIDAANELAENAEAIRWRKEVGDAAEKAFLDALADGHPVFPEPENPDNGMDFIIRIGDLDYLIELKSAVENKETVKMSIKQGETAVSHHWKYALGVISRPAGQLTNKEEFITKSRFVTDIGNKIGNKIATWKSEVSHLESTDTISIELDQKSGFVNIRKSVWTAGMTFDEFVIHLKQYFNLAH